MISCPKKPWRTASLPNTLCALSSREPDPQAGSYTLLTSVLPTVPSLVSSSDTSEGVKNSPPDLPAFDAYIVIRYSYASPKASMALSLYANFISAMPLRIFTSLSFLLATVPPSLLLFTSKSSNKPAKFASASLPFALSSIFANTRSRVSFKFSSFAAFARTLQNSSLGRMKKPFS